MKTFLEKSSASEVIYLSFPFPNFVLIRLFYEQLHHDLAQQAFLLP